MNNINKILKVCVWLIYRQLFPIKLNEFDL